MFQRDRCSQPYSDNVLEFLADREGLTGGARRRFLHVLHDYGSFRKASRPQRSRTLLLFSLLLALVGFVLDHSPSWSGRLVWPGCVLLGLGPIWRFHQEKDPAPGTDRETDWQAYCLFLRPIILIDHPGLLNRNANNIQRDSGQPILRLFPMLRNLCHERSFDFWWSAMLGLWCGMLALAITHLAVAASNKILSFVLPVGGMLFGPVIWMAWQRIIYWILKHDSRLSDHCLD